MSDLNCLKTSRGTTHSCIVYLFRRLATNRPKAAPQSKEGTNRPLGTEIPYVQQDRRKYIEQKKDRVTGLKVPGTQETRRSFHTTIAGSQTAKTISPYPAY